MKYEPVFKTGLPESSDYYWFKWNNSLFEIGYYSDIEKTVYFTSVVGDVKTEDMENVSYLGPVIPPGQEGFNYQDKLVYYCLPSTMLIIEQGEVK